MPPRLHCYLIRALSNLSIKIRSEGISNIGSMNLFQCARMELGQYLCYHLDFLLDFFTEDKSNHYLQDATSIALLSDKSAKILGSKYLIIWKFSIPPSAQIFPTRSDVIIG